MKKFFLLLSAACVAVSASAVEKKMISGRPQTVNKEFFKSVASPKADLKVAGYANEILPVKKVANKAASSHEYVYFRPADNVMSIGFNSDGSYISGLGFASSYGDIVFNNYSTGVSAYEWTYADVNDYEYDGQELSWNLKTTDAETLAIESGIGEVCAPYLFVDYNSGAQELFEINTVEYLCGVGADYWVPDYGLGISFYQNFGLQNPDGYTGSSTYKSSYNVVDKSYNSNGVYSDKTDSRNWINIINDLHEGQTVTNVALDHFAIRQSKPASAYMITKGWGWISVSANAATQLVSYIYPVDEDGVKSENPIAYGYASIAKGDTNIPVFNYIPLNEDGDEVEGEIIIDSEVIFTIEGFAGNKAINEIYFVTGFYPFSDASYKEGNYDICKEPTILVHFSYDVDGETYSRYLYDSGLYYYNQNTTSSGSMVDGDTLTMLSYAQFVTDAVFPYIIPSEKSVKVGNEGGEVELEFDALYYDINSLLDYEVYTLSAPEWITVKFGESDQSTGTTPVTLVVDPSDVDRTGIVSLSGLGVSGDIEVIQGDGNSVASITVEGAAKYYDLSGRRVVNPEKGLYIKVNGNKAEKVVL